MNLGEKIKKRRKELGINAADLAKFVGVSESTIFRYEKGDIEKMPTTVLEKIAKKLRTSPGYLMGWEEKELSSTQFLNDAKNEYTTAPKNSHVETIAAHIEEGISDEQMKDIIKYIEFVKTNKF